VYGSITSAPERFPQATQFYNDLFAGNLHFVPVAEFTSRPTLPIPGINLCITPPFFNYGKIDALVSEQFDITARQPFNAEHNKQCQGIQFVDDYADESWTVYDHPKVIIFRSTKNNHP
jgi:hypothetical protein